MRTVGIGKQDFKVIREKDLFYVDKTRFLKEWWENEDDATLITRPRRFGKTLTMSMVERFFSLEYAGMPEIFDGLEISRDKEFMKLQGTFPVISLSFSGIKEKTCEETVVQLCNTMRNFFRVNRPVLNAECFDEDEKDFFRKLGIEMPRSEVASSVKIFSEFLFRRYGKKVIIYVDSVVTSICSFLDIDKREQERIYHVLVLGIISELKDTYCVRSNRESGKGRYDVAIEPKDKRESAIILEFKVAEKGDSLEEIADSALKQIEEKKYAQDLIARGCDGDRIKKYGFAFCGKSVLIKKAEKKC